VYQHQGYILRHFFSPWNIWFHPEQYRQLILTADDPLKVQKKKRRRKSHKYTSQYIFFPLITPIPPPVQQKKSVVGYQHTKARRKQRAPLWQYYEILQDLKSHFF
jgi:hypothetical protein